MPRAMCYAIATPERGLTLAPEGRWDGNQSFEFTITGMADASNIAYHDTALSVGGHAVSLQGGSPIDSNTLIANIISWTHSTPLLNSASVTDKVVNH
jgi:hypothetical protein